MTVYTISTGATRSSFIPTTLVNVQISYSFAWCQSKKAFILFTGDATTGNPFFEYTPSSDHWTNMASASSGAIPTFRLRSCMVSAYNGTKMLLFGGDTGSASVATLSILDVKTMKWSEAKDAPDTRSDMACSVSGDNFIIWGGYKKNIADIIVGVPATPLIYNLATGDWSTKYVRGNSHNPTGSGEPPGVTDAGEKTGGGGTKSNSAAIGGGVAGGLVVIAVIAFLAVRRLRQKRDRNYIDTKHSEAVSQYDHALPSLEHTYDAPVSTAYLQGKPVQQPDIINNPQYTYVGSPQSGATKHPPAGSSDTRSHSALVLPRLNLTEIPRNPQSHIQQLQCELARSQKQLALQTSKNPKYDPNVLPTAGHTSLRDPQGAGELSTAVHPRVDQHELARKIEAMQAELQDLQAQLKLS
ncbi:hypothetical protein BGZ96_000543 [Linnemannia gamsii]|uniref:Galactose oxidase n=1 Tax=Linnemannia gamsii TaxID=64522 RepID=A0ABQ7JNV3_9FUNG|nr:hypothetical protein BGZ96_000543 [Linnemannia gamsii]